jgi:hypothetical protein
MGERWRGLRDVVNHDARKRIALFAKASPSVGSAMILSLYASDFHVHRSVANRAFSRWDGRIAATHR